MYRLWLEEPFEGRKTVVLKHTKPYVRGNKDLAFTDERQVGLFAHQIGPHLIALARRSKLRP